jgi:hypothetical protein
MPVVTKKALKVLVPSLATCGGDVGMLFGVASTLADKESGELWEIVPKYLSPVAMKSLTCLTEEAIGGEITPESVIRRFGLPKHFHEMHKEAMAGMASVAGEIPADIRAIAHTLLPVSKDGIYANEGRIIAIKNLVPLGPQKGNLVAHLSGVFASGCTDAEIEKLLHEQALDTEFMVLADKVGIIDYGGTKLREVTERARKALDL